MKKEKKQNAKNVETKKLIRDAQNATVGFAAYVGGILGLLQLYLSAKIVMTK